MTRGDAESLRPAGRRRAWGLALGVGVAAIFVPLAAAPGQDKPTTRTETCTNGTCHADIVSRGIMHRPVERGNCLDCHEYAVARDHLFRFTEPRSELCESCHELELGPTIHDPVDQGDCTGCHDPHGSDHRMLLVQEATRDLCVTCHDPEPFDKAYVHGPVAVGACVACHEPHSSSHEKLLTKASKRLCIDCHEETAPRGAAARHQHRPMSDGCTTCHDPHASEIRFQLNDANPTLCFSCHSGIKNFVATATFVHGPTVEGDSCAGCHDPHFTRLPYLQKTSQPDLCLNCHDRQVETADGRVLQDMAKLLRENPNHHGPIREGACTACHQPHAADHSRLLFREYPPEFYAPFEEDRYALCFSCHLSDLVRDESGVGLTGFRDGDLNLHWLHVNQEKGRTCRACHEIHASKRPFHMAEAVPFGNTDWMLEINFAQSADGGACTPACHKTRTYRRSNPKPGGPGATGTLGGEP
ncbi:MAG: cytochrome c3 family protein [Planctomycetota bacterium]|jgi:predicted CXXCH cytochrome family protein